MSGLIYTHEGGASNVSDLGGQGEEDGTKAQRTIWQRLVDELGEAVRKSVYRFYGELLANEGDAWRLAIAALAGNRPGRGRSQARAPTSPSARPLPAAAPG